MRTIVIDVGGTNIKVWSSGGTKKRKIPSGQGLTPQLFVRKVAEVLRDQRVDRMSIGFPGPVRYGRPQDEPSNLGVGWVDFDFDAAFEIPLRMMNDACMQALGSYEGGRMLFLGLGTSVGTTFISDGTIIPLALGHLQFGERTFDDALSRAGLKQLGKAQWRLAVTKAAGLLREAFHAEYVVLGGGNVKLLKQLPTGCRRGGNHNAYIGGVRLWSEAIASPTLNSHFWTGTSLCPAEPAKDHTHGNEPPTQIQLGQ